VRVRNTTVTGELDLVEKQRKKPLEILTSAKTTRVLFGDNPTVLLNILILDNKYNYQIGTIDQGNQLKTGYIFQEIHRENNYYSLII
jgi:hypothetical protein